MLPRIGGKFFEPVYSSLNNNINWYRPPAVQNMALIQFRDGDPHHAFGMQDHWVALEAAPCGPAHSHSFSMAAVHARS
jgi:hypothetical protein